MKPHLIQITLSDQQKQKIVINANYIESIWPCSSGSMINFAASNNSIYIQETLEDVQKLIEHRFVYKTDNKGIPT